MSKIFVPSDTTYNKCYVVSSGVIRAYNKVPQYNTDYVYREYFIHDNYNYRDVSGNWGQQQFTTLPSCINSNDLTNNFYYRVDFYQILIMFIIFSIFVFYIPIKILFRIFKRGAL